MQLRRFLGCLRFLHQQNHLLQCFIAPNDTPFIPHQPQSTNLQLIALAAPFSADLTSESHDVQVLSSRLYVVHRSKQAITGCWIVNLLARHESLGAKAENPHLSRPANRMTGGICLKKKENRSFKHENLSNSKSHGSFFETYNMFVPNTPLEKKYGTPKNLGGFRWIFLLFRLGFLRFSGSNNRQLSRGVEPVWVPLGYRKGWTIP